jgi:hypothetical protein
MERDQMFDVRPHQYATRLTLLENAIAGANGYTWFARMVYPVLSQQRHQVFVSMPWHCRAYLDAIISKFQSGLNLQVITYLRPDSAENVSEAALKLIRNADFFLGIWHPEKERSNELSPWMPFELGAAKAFGKPSKVIAHRDIPPHIKRRIMKDYALIEYDDSTFDAAITDIIRACRQDWHMQ